LRLCAYLIASSRHTRANRCACRKAHQNEDDESS
jgi:hypothetical protein